MPSSISCCRIGSTGAILGRCFRSIAMYLVAREQRRHAPAGTVAVHRLPVLADRRVPGPPPLLSEEQLGLRLHSAVPGGILYTQFDRARCARRRCRAPTRRCNRRRPRRQAQQAGRRRAAAGRRRSGRRRRPTLKTAAMPNTTTAQAHLCERAADTARWAAIAIGADAARRRGPAAGPGAAPARRARRRDPSVEIAHARRRRTMPTIGTGEDPTLARAHAVHRCDRMDQRARRRVRRRIGR